MLVAEIGQCFEDQLFGTFDATGVTGTIFCEVLPPTPDECIMIRATGGSESDLKLPYDEQTVQVLVRGLETALLATQVLAQGIYDLMHGYAGAAFVSGGLWIVLCAGQQGGPVYIGQDDNGRHEYSLNFRLTVKNDNRRTS